jgi:hypothetical protein
LRQETVASGSTVGEKSSNNGIVDKNDTVDCHRFSCATASALRMALSSLNARIRTALYGNEIPLKTCEFDLCQFGRLLFLVASFAQEVATSILVVPDVCMVTPFTVTDAGNAFGAFGGRGGPEW